MNRVILDTGPLVALLSTKDAMHDWARETIGRLEAPLSTCDAVVTEACYLLRKTKRGVEGVLSLVSRGVLVPNFPLVSEADAVAKLIAKYANVPMSLADACLVRMTELAPRAAIVTLDSDFRVYRRNGRQAVPVIMP